MVKASACLLQGDEMSKNAPMPAGTPADILKSIEMITGAIERCKSIQEQEKTKRESIRAHRDVELFKLQKQTENFHKYIEAIFKERSNNFDEFFRRLDTAIEIGDMQLANLVMAGITEQIKASPLQGVKELMLQANDPDVKHIEF